MATEKYNECLKAIKSLYFEVDPKIADDLRKKILGAFEELKKEYEDNIMSFGTYLLSEEREKSIVHDHSKRLVGRWDIENWNHLRSNIKNQ